MINNEICPIIKTIPEIKERIKILKSQNKIIGLVPTMGALHAGHASLINRAVKECDDVIVSIFVNPIQFGLNEDLEKYPRQMQSDREICINNRVTCIFAPEKAEMYPGGKNNITIVVPPLEIKEILCGKTRKGHFEGVATVVLKLFNIIEPNKTYFGEKDFQQLLIIKKMVRDFNISAEVISCPTVREESGLAMSSRNQYLSQSAKIKASSIYTALKKINELYLQGEKSAQSLISSAKMLIDKEIEIEYFESRDAETLALTEKINSDTLFVFAGKIEGTRLIDNIKIKKSRIS